MCHAHLPRNLIHWAPGRWWKTCRHSSRISRSREQQPQLRSHLGWGHWQQSPTELLVQTGFRTYNLCAHLQLGLPTRINRISLIELRVQVHHPPSSGGGWYLSEEKWWQDLVAKWSLSGGEVVVRSSMTRSNDQRLLSMAVKSAAKMCKDWSTITKHHLPLRTILHHYESFETIVKPLMSHHYITTKKLCPNWWFPS